MGTEIESFSATSMAAAAGAVDAVWGGVAPKRCDSCKTGAAATFCGADTAYLCLPCDGRIHRAKQSRVWMCEVCEQAPAAVTCKADAAALCVACDFDIHSANPVAHRHERIPIEPFVGSYAENRAYPIPEFQQQQQQYVLHNENGAAAGYSVPGGISWTQLESGFPELNQKQEELERKDRIFGEMDELLELEYGDLLEGRFQQSYSSDGVVPAQSKPAPAPLSQPGAVGLQFLLASREYGLDQLDFTQPNKLSSFGYPTQTCLSNSVSSSSHEAGVVPEGSCSNNNNNSMSEISFSFPGNNMTTCSSSSQQPAGVAKSSSTDREARVMRYREKRKNRKFEKTIRYASRKAYAETRPRIKGRFAKRCSENSSELSADHLEELLYGSSSSSASASADSIPFFGGVDSRYGYGVVPSFR